MWSRYIALIAYFLVGTRALDCDVHEGQPEDSAWSNKTRPAPGPIQYSEDSHFPGEDILTIIIDFKDSSQGTTVDVAGSQVGAFDHTAFGLSNNQRAQLEQRVLEAVENDYFTEMALSNQIGANMDLEIDFIIGDVGTAPPGISEYYYIHIGDNVGNPLSSLGRACVGCVRRVGGGSGAETGDILGAVFTEAIVTLFSSFTLERAVFSISGTLSHEIGHSLSLLHMYKAGSQTLTGSAPIMGTGALDLPTADRATDRSFTVTGFGDFAMTNVRRHVDQLIAAVGLHALPGINCGPCQAGRFQTSPCTQSSSRKCTKCRPRCTDLEVETRSCGGTKDRVCKPKSTSRIANEARVACGDRMVTDGIACSGSTSTCGNLLNGLRATNFAAACLKVRCK